MMVLGVRLSKKEFFVLINFKQVFNMIRDLHKETGTEEFAYGLIYIEHYQSVKDKINVRTFEIKKNGDNSLTNGSITGNR